VPEGQAPPVAISLDRCDREWLSLAPLMRELIPEFYTLGAFVQKERTGPAIGSSACRSGHSQRLPGWSGPHSLLTEPLAAKYFALLRTVRLISLRY